MQFRPSSGGKAAVGGGRPRGQVGQQGRHPAASCIEGHLAVIQLLLGEGAEVDKVDHFELTPLQYACMDEGIVRLLVEHGAMDPEAAKADAGTDAGRG